MSDGKIEIKPVSAYPHIPEYIPVVLLEYDLPPDEGAVQANPISTMSYLATTSQGNASLAPTP